MLKSLVISAIVLVHSWYSLYCCGEGDCFPVRADEVRENSDGSWTYIPRNMTFPRTDVLPSQDGRYHVCILQGPSGERTIPRCIYIVLGA